MPTITEILNYLLGSTTLASVYVAWKSRKSEIKKAEAGALENMQTVYDKFTEQTEKRFLLMQETIEKQAEEIQTFKNKLEQQLNICQNCKNKPQNDKPEF